MRRLAAAAWLARAAALQLDDTTIRQQVNACLYSDVDATLTWNASAPGCDASAWDVSAVTSMAELFLGVHGLDSDISAWNVSGVTDMRAMFATSDQDEHLLNPSLSGNLSDWDVSSVSYMFGGATAFNGDVSAWNVANVQDMEGMFSNAEAFNGDVSAWNVASVQDMSNMFWLAEAFNGDVSQWNVASVRDMSSMFEDATAFNGSVACWEVSSVVAMGAMFQDADAFLDDLRLWSLGPYALFDGDCFDDDFVFTDDCDSTELELMFSSPQCGCPTGANTGCVELSVPDAACPSALNCPRRAPAPAPAQSAAGAKWLLLLAAAVLALALLLRLRRPKRPPPQARVVRYARLP
jgi:surface protein